MKSLALLAAAAAVVSVPAAASAQVLFSDNFNTSTAADYTVATGPGGNAATFQYDYSELGIPAAPGSADTIGLRLQANTIAGGITAGLTGLSVSPNGQSFSGDFTISYNAWQNYGGAGTTQLATGGFGTDGTTAQFPGSVSGVLFASTSDGGSAADYRAYGPGNAGVQITAPGTYAAGSQNNTAAYYTALFPGATSPAIQGPSQTAPAGTPAFTWQNVTIAKTGNSVVYSINGAPIATIDISSFTLGGSNIFLGQSDFNSGAADTPFLTNTIFDNLIVTGPGVIPEPASLGLLGVAGLGLLRRRKA